jgi:outer membrane protein insertion porin family/translocation and assembly module TamA
MRHPPRVRSVLVALAAASALAAPAARAQGEADREVVELRFEGNETFSDRELRSAILTDQTRCRSFLFQFPFPICFFTDWGFAHEREYLDEGELPLDALRLRLFYRQRGFRQAAVDTAVSRRDGTARVAFRIEEGEPTTISRIETEVRGDAIDSATVLSVVDVAAGDRLDLVALQEGEAAVAQRLRHEGYVDAAVLRDYFIPRDSLAARVTLRVNPGPRVRVGDVFVEGEGDVGEGVVRALLSFETGDWFDDREVIDSQRRLYDLEALRFANITSERTADSVIDLRVQVAEAPRRALQTGFGVQTDECLQLQALYTSRNFFGAARTLRVTGRVSNLLSDQLQGSFPCTDVSTEEVYQDLNYLLDFTFEQPVLWGGRNSLRARIYGERETVPDLYVRKSTGGELAFTRRFTTRMSLTASYRPELTSFGEQSADIYFCVNFGLCTPEDIALLSEAKWLSPVALLWSWNRTDRVLAPTRGYYVAAQAERASSFTGSDYTYLRGSLEAAGFRKVLGEAVLGARFRFGAVGATAGTVFQEQEADDLIYPTKRFFAGGPESVRGFGLNLLGPTVLVVDEADCVDFGTDYQGCLDDDPGRFDERPVGGNAAVEGSVELRVPIARRWTAALFVDGGQVWETLDRRASLVLTPGAGVRFESPVGPLRVDFGYNPTSASARPVVVVDENGEILELEETVTYDPFTYDDPSLLTEIFRRFQLQLSIGEAF